MKDFNSKVIIKFADTDKDGKISLYEYYYFVIFMQCNFSNNIDINF